MTPGSWTWPWRGRRHCPMDKEEIEKLPEEEQDYIYRNALENETLDDIRWLERHHDYAVYKGWL